MTSLPRFSRSHEIDRFEPLERKWNSWPIFCWLKTNFKYKIVIHSDSVVSSEAFYIQKKYSFIFRKKVEQSVNHGNFFTCLVAQSPKIVNWSFDSIKFSDKFGTFILFAVA